MEWCEACSTHVLRNSSLSTTPCPAVCMACINLTSSPVISTLTSTILSRGYDYSDGSSYIRLGMRLPALLGYLLFASYAHLALGSDDDVVGMDTAAAQDDEVDVNAPDANVYSSMMMEALQTAVAETLGGEDVVVRRKDDVAAVIGARIMVDTHVVVRGGVERAMHVAVRDLVGERLPYGIVDGEEVAATLDAVAAARAEKNARKGRDEGSETHVERRTKRRKANKTVNKMATPTAVLSFLSQKLRDRDTLQAYLDIVSSVLKEYSGERTRYELLQSGTTISREPMYVVGRYTKLSREISNTKMVVGGKRITEHSVGEELGACVVPIFSPGMEADELTYNFISSGREDVDVRMLGDGRPFSVQVRNGRRLLLPGTLLEEAEHEFNASHSTVQISSLQVTDKAGDSRLKAQITTKKKAYYAVVYVTDGYITRQAVEGLAASAPLNQAQRGTRGNSTSCHRHRLSYTLSQVAYVGLHELVPGELGHLLHRLSH